MRTAVNSPAAWQTRVPHNARSAAAVRRWLAEVVGDLASSLQADLNAVATELICNAVRHAAPLPDGALAVRCGLVDDSVEFSVTDGGADTLPRRRRLDPDASNGRGLIIVEALSKRWGVREEAAGRTVWARLPGAA